MRSVNQLLLVGHHYQYATFSIRWSLSFLSHNKYATKKGC